MFERLRGLHWTEWKETDRFKFTRADGTEIWIITQERSRSDGKVETRPVLVRASA